MLDFIVNPVAGGKRGRKIANTIEKIKAYLTKRKIDFSMHFTHKKGGAKELTAEVIKNGAKIVVAVGGDGTLHEVINGFSNFDEVAMGIIPCGTGNDFASAINLPFDVEKALDLIIDGQPKYTDFMQMPTVRGLNVIGTGIDVDVLRRYEKKKKKNKLAYTTCLIKTLFRFNYVKFGADVDGEKEDYTSFIACIANGDRFGGGMKVCPPADPTDGKLNFVAVDQMKKIKIINALLKLKKGKLLTLKQAHHKLANRIEIMCDGDYTVNVDGELYDNIPFIVEVVSNTLRMYR